MSRFKIGAAAAAAGLAVALVTTPAQAHVSYAYHGEDWAKVGTEHLHISVRDNECDGNYALARLDFDSSSSNGWDYEFWNLSGCGNTDGQALSDRVVRYTACEGGNGCSAWKQP